MWDFTSILILQNYHHLSNYNLKNLNENKTLFNRYKFGETQKYPIIGAHIGFFPIVHDTEDVVVELLSRVQLLVTSWTAAHQASLSLIISHSLPKFMSVESVVLSNYLNSMKSIEKQKDTKINNYKLSVVQHSLKKHSQIIDTSKIMES